MMYLGSTGAKEDVWLVLAPTECLGNHVDLEDVTITRASATVDSTTGRVLMAMLAYMMEKINYSNIYLMDLYPNCSSDADLSAATNLV